MSAGRKINTESQNWNTPPKIIKLLYDFFGEIDLDPCSNEYSLIKAKDTIIYPERDGLIEDWNGHNIYVNPPYGRNSETRTTIYDWIKKCSDANKRDSEVIALIPVATNTKHWKDIIFKTSSCILFLSDTRLKFYLNGEEYKKGAPMACAMIYWGKNVSRFNDVFKECGFIYNL